MHHHTEILTALVGQPNSGKSTIFNYLTGLHQTIANYPGVTVTKKSGHYHEEERRIEVVDLPGTYSLTSYSQEERVTRDFLLLEQPEVVVAVVDASNLRRHLFFVFQLLELQIPLVVCLNMMDIAKRRGMNINVQKLEQELGIPVVPASARTGEGLDVLRQKISEISKLHHHNKEAVWKIDYAELEPVIAGIDKTLSQKEYLAKDFATRWLALKLLENDREARRIVQHHIHERNWEPLIDSCTKIIEDYEKSSGESPRKTIAARRNQRAEEIERNVAERVVIPKRKSDAFDRILCHPVFGLPAVAMVMFITFQLAFNISGKWTWIPFPNSDYYLTAPAENNFPLTWTSPSGAVENIFDDWIPLFLDKTLNLPDGDLKSLIYDGIVAGVGGVIVFVPVIFFIFLFVSLLNQSGYMARIVMVLDRLMRFFHLHGQSTLPMILGGGIIGGCAVPAVMATRTMREPKERLLTILVIPLMNCGAKVPVYALLIGAFFSAYQGFVMAAVVFTSWMLALVTASVLGETVVKGESTPLLIELPTYQIPGVFETLATACRQSWMFLKKAGTVILAVNVILWALMYYPAPEKEDATASERLQGSYAASIGRFFEPVSRFAGFGWQDNVALVGGFAAKEAVISALATIYGIENEDSKEPEQPEIIEGEPEEDEVEKKLAEVLQNEKGWSPVKAFAMMIFVMVYAPCFATCAVIWRETGYIKYMLLAMIYTTLLGGILAVAVFQIGTFITNI